MTDKHWAIVIIGFLILWTAKGSFSLYLEHRLVSKKLEIHEKTKQLLLESKNCKSN